MTQREYSRRRHARAGGGHGRAPALFRWFLWAAVILLFLALGYYGSGILFQMMDRRGGLPEAGVVTTVEQMKSEMEKIGEQNVAVGKPLTLTIYTLGVSGTEKGELKIISDHQEADISRALNTLFVSSSEKWLQSVSVRHLFRDGVTLYVDLPGAFSVGLEALGKERGQVLITGILRTVVENFDPVKRVIFLINGQTVKQVAELPLSSPWELGPQK